MGVKDFIYETRRHLLHSRIKAISQGSKSFPSTSKSTCPGGRKFTPKKCEKGHVQNGSSVHTALRVLFIFFTAASSSACNVGLSTSAPPENRDTSS